MSNKNHLLTEQVKALTAISTAVASEFDFQQLCSVAAEQACNLLQCKTVLVPIINDDHTEYTYISGFGENTDDIVGESLSLEIGVCGWVLKHQQPWWKGVLKDLHPQERTMWEKEANNLLLVPLKGKKTFLGGLACIDKKDGFNKIDFELLKIIATPIALALENSLLVSNLEDKIAQRTADLLQEKNKAEKANRAKSAFLANISHELRTPMHAILSYSSMGIDFIESADRRKLHKYYKNIHSSGKRLLLLLDDLLDLSKLEAGKVTFDFCEASLQSVIEDTITEFEALAKEKNISMTYSPVTFDTTLIIDANKITQVLNNLLSNAIKFSDTGGEVSISLKDSSAIMGACNKRNDDVSHLIISIADTGIGIPENELDTVFDKFMQSSRTETQAGGTGLGLSICKEIISEHMGLIYAKNNSDRGATFTVHLPKVAPLHIHNDKK